MLFNEFIHCLIVHEIKYNRSDAPHASKITVIKWQIWNLSPSLPPWHQAALARSASSLFSLLEGVMDLTLWGYPSWTLWGRQQDWLCRRSTQWGWRATSCPSRFAWPWSSLRIHHLQEAGKGDWLVLGFCSCFASPEKFSALRPGMRNHPWWWAGDQESDCRLVMVGSDNSGEKMLGPPILERDGRPQNMEKLALACLVTGCFSKCQQ